MLGFRSNTCCGASEIEGCNAGGYTPDAARDFTARTRKWLQEQKRHHAVTYCTSNESTENLLKEGWKKVDEFKNRRNTGITVTVLSLVEE